MKFIVLSSSSKANGYLLETKEEALVLEAGVSLLQLKKVLNFELEKIVGCIITHRHLDHSKYWRQYAKNGIIVFGPPDLFISPHNRCFSATGEKWFRVGGFKVLPFPLHHDVPCFGYLIDHKESGKILFITDTYLCEYIFPDLQHIIIETNYSDDILEANIFNGIEPASKRERLLTTHMELQTTKVVIMAQDLSKMQTIILIHLSDNNSDEVLFAEEIAASTGIRTFIATSGLTVDLNVEPF